MAKRAFVRAWRAHQPPFRCETYSRQYLKQMLPMKGGGSAQKNEFACFTCPLVSAQQVSCIPRSRPPRQNSEARTSGCVGSEPIGLRQVLEEATRNPTARPVQPEARGTHIVQKHAQRMQSDAHVPLQAAIVQGSQPGSQSLAEP